MAISRGESRPAVPVLFLAQREVRTTDRAKIIYRYEQGPQPLAGFAETSKTQPNPLPVEEGETMLRDLERHRSRTFLLAREQIFRTLTSCRK